MPNQLPRVDRVRARPDALARLAAQHEHELDLPVKVRWLVIGRRIGPHRAVYRRGRKNVFLEDRVRARHAGQGTRGAGGEGELADGFPRLGAEFWLPSLTPLDGLREPGVVLELGSLALCLLAHAHLEGSGR